MQQDGAHSDSQDNKRCCHRVLRCPLIVSKNEKGLVQLTSNCFDVYPENGVSVGGSTMAWEVGTVVFGSGAAPGSVVLVFMVHW